ncbi:MFS transporter [Cellulomonas sp.]|uniref:MFS transporter n=1 Tax=Cellulomonas sp. TaxID=40001 RepID=UPI002811A6DB|nr:MFS transporter [Cellulomonas sp.]
MSTVVEPAVPAPPAGRGAAGRRRAVRLVWVHGLSSFCWGMVYPYTAIFLARDPGVGTSGAGLYFATAGIANVAVAVVLALGWWRPTTTWLGVLGNGASVLGYASVVAVGSPAGAVAAGALVGLGQGAFLAAIVPTVGALLDEQDRRSVFALRYAVLNGTLAAGAMVTGLLTLVVPPERLLVWLFPVTAAGYLPLVVLQVRLRHEVARAEALATAADAADADGHGRTGARWSPLRLVRACAWLIALQLVAYLVGFSQFESTAPLAVDRLLDVPLVWVSVMLGVNTASIVVLQAPVTRLLGRFPVRTGLRVTMLAWAAAYLLLAATAHATTPVVVGGLLLFAVLFALGECAYSCTFHPWLLATVPERELVRATATANSMMGVGLAGGPLLGVALVQTGAVPLWTVLAGLAVVGSFVALGAPGRTDLAPEPARAGPAGAGRLWAVSRARARR